MAKATFTVTVKSTGQQMSTSIWIISVEEIECISDLDEGSNNKGDGGTQDGFIYGKEYEFKIKKYQDDSLPSEDMKKKIIWEYSYKNEDGERITNTIESSGETFKLKIDNLEMLGKEVSICAYLGKQRRDRKLEFLCHNRFRYFDIKNVEQQIEERLVKPWKINQGGTSLCGMACLFYIFAKNDKQGYKTLAETLHRTGKATHNGYTVEPDEDAKEEMYNTNPKTSKEHPWIPEIDWITMATTRSKESDFGYTGKKGQDASAINWPWLMTNLGKKLLGYSTVEMDYYKVNKSYIRDFFGSDEKIRILEEDIDKDYQNGFEICMMIDGDMVASNPGPNYSINDFGEYHWVTYEGGLELLNSEKRTEPDYDKVTNVEFNVVTWGELKDGKTLDDKNKPMDKIEITKKQFISNYYGYLKLK